MTEPSTPAIDVTASVDTSHAVGDQVTYTGSLGEHTGVIAEVRDLFDEHGAHLTAFVVELAGLGRVLCSGDSLSPVKATPAPAWPASASGDMAGTEVAGSVDTA